LIASEVIFFDAVGTLFTLRAPVGEIYLDRARRYGFNRLDVNLGSRITESFRQAFRAQGPLAFPGAAREQIPALEFGWWKRVVRDTFAPYGGVEREDELFPELFDLFRTDQAWQLEPDAVGLLAELRQRGRRLGMITNYDSRVRDVLVSLGIARFFDDVIVSSEAREAKPGKEIFLEGCSRLRTDPRMALHIGDDPREDYEGAKAAGLNAILYDPKGVHAEKAVRVGRLVEVLEILV
jgi:putative hydrolase of the HAD superfamily